MQKGPNRSSGCTIDGKVVPVCRLFFEICTMSVGVERLIDLWIPLLSSVNPSVSLSHYLKGKGVLPLWSMIQIFL